MIVYNIYFVICKVFIMIYLITMSLNLKVELRLAPVMNDSFVGNYYHTMHFAAASEDVKPDWMELCMMQSELYIQITGTNMSVS